MDAATAALWASSITGVVALGVGWLNPHLTAKRARETELLKMRRDAYVAALEAVVHEPGDFDNYELLVDKMIKPLTLMRLFASPDIAELYNELWMVAQELAVKEEDKDEVMLLLKRFNRELKDFAEAARAHLGVDEIER